jgi:DNA-binding NtrC family response regulator
LPENGDTRVIDGTASVGTKGHVVLIDDDELVRRFAVKALNRMGYKVSACVDGADGVQFYRDNHEDVDLVISDMVMPNMDGMTAFREMKKINAGVRVILASGYSMDDEVSGCLDEGAVAFLPKPYQLMDLINIVETHITGRKVPDS